jgi:hypothetical protein
MQPALNFIYVPMSQNYRPQTNLFVCVVDEGDLSSMLKRVVARFDPRLPILDQSTMDDEVSTSLFAQQLALGLTASLGIVALPPRAARDLCCGCLQRRTAHARDRYSRRRHWCRRGGDRGIRRHAMLASFLFGVPPTDVVAFSTAGALLIAAALLATWLPARRAAGLNPITALRPVTSWP